MEPTLQEIAAQVEHMMDRNRSMKDIESLLATYNYDFLTFANAYDLQQRTNRDVNPEGSGQAGVFKHHLSMSWADEMSGLWEGLFGRKDGETFSDAYKAQRDIAREDFDQYKRSGGPRGTAAAMGVLGAVAGGVVGGMAAAPLVPSALVPEHLGTMVAAGVTAGGVGGGFEALGNARGNFQAQADATMRGVGAGALIGGGLTPVIAGTAWAGSRIANLIRAPGVARAGKMADQKIVQALDRDRIDLDAVVDEHVRNTARNPKDEVLADYAGENTRGLGRAAQAIPSDSKADIAEMLYQRMQGASDRVASDIGRAARRGRDDIFAIAEDLKVARGTQANELYDAAYEAGRGVVIDLENPAVRNLLGDPEIGPIFRRAQLLAARNGVELQPIYRAIGKDGMTVDINGMPNQIVAYVRTESIQPDLQTMDYLKRGIDSYIDAGFRGAGMSTAEAASLKKLRTPFVEYLDELVPEYNAARSAYAGAMEVDEALVAGARAMRMDPREIVHLTKRMSAAELEMFQLSAADAVRELAREKSGLSRLIDLRARPKDMDRMKAIFGPNAPELIEDLLREARMKTTTQGTLGNSVTARAQAEMAELQGGGLPGEMLAGAAERGARGVIGPVVRRGLNRSAGTGGNVADAMAARLYNPRQGALEAYVNTLKGTRDAMARQSLQRSGRHLGAAVSVGGADLRGLFGIDQ